MAAQWPLPFHTKSGTFLDNFHPVKSHEHKDNNISLVYTGYLDLFHTLCSNVKHMEVDRHN